MDPPEEMTGRSLLVRNGLVVTMDPARRVLRTNVFLEGGRIAECPSERGDADDVIDATDCLVIPGLIQSHVHLCQALFRGTADDLDVVDWLRLRIWPFEQAHDEESVYDSARLAIAEMLLGGTTCALTIETVRHTEAAFEAVLESGFRAVSGKAMMDRFEPGTEMVGEDGEASLEESIRLLHAYHGRADGRLRYAFCPRGARNVSERTWREVAAVAEEHGVTVHTHAAENRTQTARLAADGGTDLTYLAGLGVLAPRMVLAHCVWVSEDEMRLLAETGATVAHCPSANMKLASGFAPIPEMLELGVNVGLGADGAPCNNNLDMFNEMRLAALVHKPRAGPKAMPAGQILEMATIRGARAIGQAAELGSIELGKRADLVLVRRDRLHVQPSVGTDPVTQLVYEHRSSDVDTVIVDGRVLVQDGRLVALDEEEVRFRANRSAARVLARAGVTVPP